MQFRLSGGEDGGQMDRRQRKRPGGLLLARYLDRAGLSAEARLAHEGITRPRALVKLEELLRRQQERLPVSPILLENKALLRLFFGSSRDLVSRKLACGSDATPAFLIYLNSMVDPSLVQRSIGGLLKAAPEAPSGAQADKLVEWLALNRAVAPDIGRESHYNRIIQALTEGEAFLFVAGAVHALRLTLPGGPERGISEPETERVIRGPRAGFVESIGTNTSLIRRILRDHRLRVESHTVGELTSTRVAILYLHTICKQSVVDEARRRIKRIKTDGILESGYIQEFIEDTPWTVFPLLKNTERPDAAVSALLEGRMVILTDGSPFCLIAPTFFIDMMQAPEDYYERFPIVFMLRILRWLFAIIALLGPAFYVAFTTFHQEMIPTSLLLSIMASREGVPLPAMVEALMMEIAFEALREAGVRLPKPVGQAISIVGALILGEAAVQAGIVSAPMVIVVAITGIASFIVPKFSAAVALRLLRFPILILAGSFGAYGITLGVMMILLHTLSLRSFGAPYLAPLGPWLPEDHSDVVVRTPHWANRKRPASSEALDRTRTGKRQKPGPGQSKGGSS